MLHHLAKFLPKYYILSPILDSLSGLRLLFPLSVLTSTNQAAEASKQVCSSSKEFYNYSTLFFPPQNTTQTISTQSDCHPTFNHERPRRLCNRRRRGEDWLLRRRCASTHPHRFSKKHVFIHSLFEPLLIIYLC